MAVVRLCEWHECIVIEFTEITILLDLRLVLYVMVGGRLMCLIDGSDLIWREYGCIRIRMSCLLVV